MRRGLRRWRLGAGAKWLDGLVRFAAEQGSVVSRAEDGQAAAVISLRPARSGIEPAASDSFDARFPPPARADLGC
jgi:hypothetical protein